MRVSDLDILKCVGKGAFSCVYEVCRKTDGRKFALKRVMMGNMINDKARRDCLNEIDILKRLNHEGIIRYVCYELTEENGGGTLSIILELASAGDLGGFVTRRAVANAMVPETLVWKFAGQISSALAHMHANKIMHRDLKPANVFMMDALNVKLGDLGLSKYFADDGSAHSVLGTPCYMSPERLMENGYSFDGDIWSLGCVIYELVALQCPFYINKPDVNLLVHRICRCEYPPVPSDSYSKELLDLIDKCIERVPEKRPAAWQVYQISQKFVPESHR